MTRAGDLTIETLLQQIARSTVVVGMEEFEPHPPREAERAVTPSSPRRRPPVPVIALAAVLALLLGGVLAITTDLFRGTPTASGAAVREPPASAPSAASPGPSVSPATAAPATATPAPTASAPNQRSPLLVRGSADSLQVTMRPGPDGGLWVLVDGAERAALALLDATGHPRAGWPLRLPDVSMCAMPGTADDGGVRVMCVDDGSGDTLRLFAFDPAGQPLAGWPVSLSRSPWIDSRWATVAGDRLVLLVHDEERASSRLISIDAGGATSTGPTVADPDDDGAKWALAPDGTGYVLGFSGLPDEDGGTTEIVAFDAGGIRPGWPVTIEGFGSVPAFRADGSAVLVVGGADAERSRIEIIQPDGHVLVVSDPITVSGRSDGIGGRDDPPIVGPTGAVFVAHVPENTVVHAVDASGELPAGWPYVTSRQLTSTTSCDTGTPGDTGCMVFYEMPAAGISGDLYLPLGRRLVAVAPSGAVRTGWPIDLVAKGAFHAITPSSAGTVFVLAIQPEAVGTSSATILAIAPDSTVLWKATIIQP